MNYLYLDIETIPSGEKLKPSDFKHPKNYSKQETIYNWYKTEGVAKVEEEYRKRAVSHTKARILCIGYAYDNEEPECLTGTEEEIASGLEKVIRREYGHEYAISLVGHNAKSFDFPKIYRMACKTNNEFLKRFFTVSKRPRYSEMFIDTMELFSFSDKLQMISMNDICEFFGIKGKGDINGSKVYDLFVQDKLDEIYEYCKDDIRMLREVHNKLIV